MEWMPPYVNTLWRHYRCLTFINCLINPQLVKVKLIRLDQCLIKNQSALNKAIIEFGVCCHHVLSYQDILYSPLPSAAVNSKSPDLKSSYQPHQIKTNIHYFIWDLLLPERGCIMHETDLHHVTHVVAQCLDGRCHSVQLSHLLRLSLNTKNQILNWIPSWIRL